MTIGSRVFSTPPIRMPTLRSYLPEAIVVAFLLIGSAAAGCSIVHVFADQVSACKIAKRVP
jgi:hypothetical protein